VTSGDSGPRATRAGIIAALAAVYIIWGSTYLAIRFAVETLPPFLMAGVRFVVAGGVLYGWRRARGFPRPTPAQWRSATIVGGLMLLGGNGGVVWAEQWIESGTAALIVASVPLWMVLLDWLSPGGRAPRRTVWAGIVVGLVGVAMSCSAPRRPTPRGTRRAGSSWSWPPFPGPSAPSTPGPPGSRPRSWPPACRCWPVGPCSCWRAR
jgi:drug/metabolite transporter (DMT)-like permease